MAGRPKKPTGPQPTAPEGCPDKPTDLSAEASAEWDLLVSELSKLGTISEVDRACIAMAARYAGHYAQADAEVQRDGLTVATKQGMKAHPSLRARDDSARILKSYLDALGLTPTSRSKVTASRQEDGPSLEDVLDGDGTAGSAKRRQNEAV
jgi:P27 family predicted phage terminase small subunit